MNYSPNDISEDEAAKLIGEHHIIAMDITVGAYEFTLGNGQTLVLWASEDYGDTWELRP